MKKKNTYGIQFYLADDYDNILLILHSVVVELVVLLILHIMDALDPMSSGLISLIVLYYLISIFLIFFFSNLKRVVEFVVFEWNNWLHSK